MLSTIYEFWHCISHQLSHKYNNMSNIILSLSTYQQVISNLHPNINLKHIKIIIYYIYFWETDLTSTCDKYLAVVKLWPRSVITCACERSGSVGHDTHGYSHGSTHKYPQVYDTHAHPYYWLVAQESLCLIRATNMVKPFSFGIPNESLPKCLSLCQGFTESPTNLSYD